MQKPEELKLEIHNETDSESDSDVDEDSGILIDEHIKIFDPETNKVFMNKRGES